MFRLDLTYNADGSADVWVFFDGRDSEFAKDFLEKQPKGDWPQKILDYVRKQGKGIRVRSIKIVVAGALLASLPFGGIKNNHAAARYAMSYVYGGTVAQQIANVDKTHHALNTVSPSYFNLNADGSLDLSSLSKEFIDGMHARSIRVVPFLSNHWDRAKGQKALQNGAALTDALAKAIATYNLDGINVDIENVTQQHRAAYSDFVRMLRQKIPAQKEVSVAVAANPDGLVTGWHGSYDVAALGRYADYLMIMAYDEHYQGGPAGPVASLPFVEKSIQYALKYTSGDKIVLGIPFFGRIWNMDGSFNGQGVSLGQAEKIISTFGASVTYDKTAASPKATFTVKAGTPTMSVLGKQLAPGSYTLWYENDASIKEKLALISQYSLKGSGSWSLGGESANVWSYYAAAANGQAPTDSAKPLGTGIVSTVSTPLALRSAPNDGSAILLYLPKGTRVSVLEKLQNGWMKVREPGGKTGYVSGTYIKMPVATAPVYKVVTASALRVRSGPGTAYRVVGNLPKGTRVRVLGTSGAYTKTTYLGKTAYVATRYLK